MRACHENLESKLKTNKNTRKNFKYIMSYRQDNRYAAFIVFDYQSIYNFKQTEQFFKF